MQFATIFLSIAAKGDFNSMSVAINVHCCRFTSLPCIMHYSNKCSFDTASKHAKHFASHLHNRFMRRKRLSWDIRLWALLQKLTHWIADGIWTSSAKAEGSFLKRRLLLFPIQILNHCCCLNWSRCNDYPDSDSRLFPTARPLPFWGPHKRNSFGYESRESSSELNWVNGNTINVIICGRSVFTLILPPNANRSVRNALGLPFISSHNQ